MRVLVVEDERLLADRIAEGLRDQGMAVDVAYDGNSGLEKGLFTGYDVVVLDRDWHGLLEEDGSCVHGLNQSDD